ELFEAQVARTPDARAVVYQGGALTYSELDRRANQLAHALRRRGVTRESCVGVCHFRSVDLLVAILGILKAGGVVVPLDPTYPADRRAFMMAETRMHVVVTQQSLRTDLPSDIEVVVLDEEAERLAAEPTSSLGIGARSNQLLYVIFT